jgi:hypothetical protein
MLKSPVLIVNAIRVERSIVACSLIARYLRDRLSCEVLDGSEVELKHSGYGTVILINSPWGFCEESHRARVRDLLWRASRVVWVQNDYNSGIGPRSFKTMGAWLDGADTLREALTGKVRGPQRRLDLWTTIPEYVERGFVTTRIPLSKRSTYVNWNALHYVPLKKIHHTKMYRKKGELFYFGAFRPDRAERFKRYLTPTRYQVLISTAVGRSVERFRALLGPKVKIEAREQNLVPRLQGEWATVYIEDERADELYCSPAGR